MMCIVFLAAGILSCRTESPTGTPGGSGTVHGTVVDNDGLPVQGMVVTIDGRASLPTGADGSFSLTGIQAPYTAAVGSGFSVIYKNVLRFNPVFSVRWISQSSSHRIINCNGAGDALVSFQNGKRRWEGYRTNSASPYIIDVIWGNTGAPVVGTVHVLRRQNTPSGYDYTGYAAKKVTLTDTAVITFLDSDFIDPPEDTLIAYVGGNNITNVTQVLWLFSGDVPTLLLNQYFQAGSKVPVLPDLTVGIAASAQGAGWTVNIPYGFLGAPSLSTGATPHTLGFPEIPTLLAPIHNAVNVDSSYEFRWSNPNGQGVFLLAVSLTSYAQQPYFDLWTDDTAETLQTLKGLGVPLTSQTRYTWSVRQYTNVPTVDEMTTLEGLSYPAQETCGWSERYSFTTR